jgi:hypothetical protein
VYLRGQHRRATCPRCLRILPERLFAFDWRLSNPDRVFRRPCCHEQPQTKPALDQCSPNPINVGVGSHGPIHTFAADEQVLLQAVRFWSFLDHPQGVAFEAVSEGCVIIQHIISAAEAQFPRNEFSPRNGARYFDLTLPDSCAPGVI